jgi:excinuclease ABC subunit B
MYADKVTDSLRTAMGEMERRRAIQAAYNEEHGITPQSIIKSIDEVMSSVYERDYMTPALPSESDRFRTPAELAAHLASLQDQMKSAAANLDFEKAAALRDEIKRLRDQDLGLLRPVRRA